MGEMVTFASDAGEVPGYLARPAGGSGAGVVLIQEWWGLVPHITDLADRLAAEGFVTVAPDLYRGESTTEPDIAAKALMALDRERAAKDIAGAAAYLLSRSDVTSQQIGTIGFCMGGSLAVWAADSSADIAAMVGFYPAMPWTGFSPQPDGYAGRYVQLHLDEGDGGSDEPQVVAAVESLRVAGAAVEVIDYPGTHHAFFNDTRPEVYDADATRLAWSRSLDFLRAHLS